MTETELSFAYRGISTLFTLVLIYLFAPGALKRFLPVIVRDRWAGTAIVMGLLIASSGAAHVLGQHSIYHLFLATLWALSIGVEEDTFARGLDVGR